MSTNRMNVKKMQKKIELEDIAFDFFCQKGIKKTSIDEIVEKADIAKGTFYLYFKNKQKLVDDLVLREAIKLINAAIESIDPVDMKKMSLENKVIAIVDYILSYFKENPMFLEFIYKDLYRGILRSEHRDEILMRMTQKANMQINSSIDIVEKKLYLAFELIGTTMYSAILCKEPYEIDDIKPVLYNALIAIIQMPM